MPSGTPNGKDDLPHRMTPEELLLLEQQFAQASLEVQAERGDIGNRQRDVADKLRKALNVSTDIVVDPAAARRLAARHNAHVRAAAIARHMFDAYAGIGDVRTSAMEQLDLERAYVRENGVFVYRYTELLEELRITALHPDGSREYVIAETSGSHYRQGHMRYGAAKPAADAQFRLPEPVRHAKPVFTVPDGTREPVADDLTNKVILGQVNEHPERVAQLEDIAVDPDMGQMGLTSHAIDRGLREIVERINPARGDHAIEYIVAEIISIRGMVLKGGHELFFDHEIPGTAILNGRSMVVFDHFESDYVTSFAPAWTLQNRRVPVEGHPHVEDLIANWYVKYARVKK